MKTLCLASILCAGAQVAAYAQDAPPAAGSAAAPIVINSCIPMLQNGNGQNVAGIQLTERSGGIKIQFTNESSKTANLINFNVDSNGTSFVIRDVGSFSPGVEITHRYTNGAGQAFVLPAFLAPQVKCAVESVHFTDGSIWPALAAAAAQPAASASSGTLSATPSRVEAPVRGSLQYFMVSTQESIAGFSERDACSGIAAVALVVAGKSSATYSVKPIAPGSCTATIADQDGHTLSVAITIR